MKSEDLALLRLAAKAANVPVQDDTDGTLQARPILSVPYSCHGMMTANEWNPLRDDATALRLAVALKIELFFTAAYVIARNTSDNHPVDMYDNDPYAATRRAIVRAAAEIGSGSDEIGSAK